MSGDIKYMTIDNAMHYYKVPAISFAVIQHNQLVWNDAIGYVDSKHTKQITKNTLFQVGSLTKTVTALTVLKLVDENKFNLDSPVNPKLDGWKIQNKDNFKSDAVNLRNLLSMSSGLSAGGGPGYMPGSKLPTLIQLLSGKAPANNPPVELIYKPNTKYFYSNGGYEVVELLIDSQLNKGFIPTVNDTVLKPLKMHHSYMEQPLLANLQANAAKATDDRGKTFPYSWRVMKEYAAGGLWSTSTDMAKVVIALNNAYQGKKNSFLSEKTAKETLTKQKNTSYGLGFVVSGKGSKLRFMKLGQNVGYQSWLVGYPNTGQGMIVLTNSDNGRKLAQSLIYAIAKAYHWPTNGKLQDAWMIN